MELRVTNTPLPSDRLVNLFGALVQWVSDEMRGVMLLRFPAGGQTAAALSLIGHKPGMSIDQIGKALRLSHAGAARVVERLLAQNFVSKSPSAEDRRVIQVCLTAVGQAERRALLDRRSTVITGLLTAVSERDLAALERIAETILVSLPRDEVSTRTTCSFCDPRKCTECPTEIGAEENAN